MKVYGFDLKTENNFGKANQVTTHGEHSEPTQQVLPTESSTTSATMEPYEHMTLKTEPQYGNSTLNRPDKPNTVWHVQFYNNPAIADGKVYATAEHTPHATSKRGDKLYALTDTGELLWSIMGCNNQIAIADGVLVASDSYMPFMYGFAKGLTEITVTASPKPQPVL